MDKLDQGRPVLDQQGQVLVEGVLAEDEGVPGHQVGAEDAGRQEDEHDGVFQIEFAQARPAGE